MKKYFTLVAFFAILHFGASGQTMQLKYNVSNSFFNASSLVKEKLKNTSKLNLALDSQQTVNITSINECYKHLSDTFGVIGNTKKLEALKNYNRDLNNLKLPGTGQDISIYNTQMNNLKTKYEADLSAANLFLNEQKSLDYLARTSGSFNYFFKPGGFVNDANDAQMFYNDQITNTKYSLLSSTGISFGYGGKTASIYNELYADYFGPIRFGVGVLINNQSSSDSSGQNATDTTKTQQDAVQQLIGGGGNGVVTLSYPLLSYQSSSNQFNIKVYVSPKGSADVPKIGTATNSPAFNYDLGGEAGLYYSGVLNEITLFTHLRSGYVGGSTEFYTGLNKTDNKPFFLNQFSLGIAITSVFRISYNTYFGDRFVNKTFSNSISVAISSK